MNKRKPKIITVKNYKSMDIESLQNDLEEAPWHIVNAVEEVEDSVHLWETMFKGIVDSHIKRRKVKIRNKLLPWIDIGIRKAMNQRYKYLKSAQAKPDDNALWKLYKIKRNSVKKMLRKAESQYWIKLADNASTP